MKKIIVATLATAALFATAACQVPEENNKPGAQRATTGAKGKDSGKADSKPEKDAPKESVSQANARASADDYISMSGFSRAGLIKQLKFEGFNLKDATYGADAVNADWMKEAVEAAKDYLDTSAFSHSGLVTQLKFEGFTPEQAEYGTKKAGL